jgi:diguanylate cyclase (GGDEF)-like protein
MAALEPSDRDHDLLPLEVLLDLARSASEDPLEGVLQTVAETILKTAGYTTVVLNLYRPEWDDYEVVIVIGDDESRELLEGTCTTREVILRLLEDADHRSPSAYFFAGDRSPVWEELGAVYTPKLEPADHSDAWRADDALLVMLSDAVGEPLGFVSIDEPASGRRPTDAELNLVTVICSFAEQALRMARRVAGAERDNQLLAELSEISPALSACTTIEQLQELVLNTLTGQFGFQRAAIYRRGEQGIPVQVAARGWDSGAPALKPRWSSILDRFGGTDTTGVKSLLLDAVELYGEDAGLGDRGSDSGRGPRSWRNHCLVIPWKVDEDDFAGVVVLQDPVSLLLPTEEHRRAICLLVDLAASVATGIEQRLALDRLASHDSLTGVRNRRGLDTLSADRGPAAVLLCDLDHFKQINDRFGHHAGDRVLSSFGALLRRQARFDDVPIRLGGEEFCMVLPRTDLEGAKMVADRLRDDTESLLADVVPGGATVSIGVAVSDADPIDVPALLKRADQALYSAKQAGRNRVVIAADVAVESEAEHDLRARHPQTVRRVEHSSI